MTTPFGAWLKERYKQLGMTQEVFAGLMGVRQSTVSRWANGGDITADRVSLLAQLLQVSIEELVRRIGGEEVPETARLVQEDPPIWEWVPITGAASAGQDRTVSSDDYVVLPPRRSKRYPGRRQSLEVRGDCLSPEINPGAHVIVDPDIAWRPGQTIALRHDGGVQVKRLIAMGDGRLVLGSRHGEMILPETDTRIVGTVVAYQQYLEV